MTEKRTYIQIFLQEIGISPECRNGTAAIYRAGRGQRAARAAPQAARHIFPRERVLLAVRAEKREVIGMLSAASLGLAPSPAALFTSEMCLKHEPGWFNPERPERLSSLLEAMRAEWATEFMGQVPLPHRDARTLAVAHAHPLPRHTTRPAPCRPAEHPRARRRRDA